MASRNEHLRDLAKRYMEVPNTPAQQQLRRDWSAHNSLKSDKPMFFVRKIPYPEFFDYSTIESEDPVLRGVETGLAHFVDYRFQLDDDFIYEPWVTIEAVTDVDVEDRWGIRCGLGEIPQTDNGRGSAKFTPSICSSEDLVKLRRHPYRINEQKTKENLERVQDAIGDIIPVHVNRQGLYSRTWNLDISTDLAKLVGLEEMMYDIYDEPEMLHEILKFMQKAILDDLDAYEKSGGVTSAENDNQSMGYSEEIRNPDPFHACKLSDTWGFFASQEFTCIGPAAFNEFLLDYQIPIIERFGLSAYGCCEDLQFKIDSLRRIKNLRRIAVTPFTDIQHCAEQIGRDYVLSWRPNPSSMIATGLDEPFVRKTVRDAVSIFRRENNIFDVTLKDVETIHHSPENLVRWTKILREELG